jgi:hypothetical protein
VASKPGRDEALILALARGLTVRAAASGYSERHARRHTRDVALYWIRPGICFRFTDFFVDRSQASRYAAYCMQNSVYNWVCVRVNRHVLNMPEKALFTA